MEFDQQFIDNYIRNREVLKQEEITLFEKKIKGDKVLAEEVKIQEDIIFGLSQAFDQELKQKLKNADAHPAPKVISLYQMVAIAASLLLLLVVGYISLRPNKSVQQIYLSYYQPYPNIVVPTERGDTFNSENAYTLYEQKNYKAAVTEFQKLVEEEPDNTAHQFYLGLSAMEVSDYSLAENSLLKVLEKGENRFNNPTHWYLALLYIRESKLDKTTEMLDILMSTNSTYASKAEKLLDEI